MKRVHDFMQARPALLMTSGVALAVLMFSIEYATKADVVNQLLLAQNAAPAVESPVVSLTTNGPQATDVTLTENTVTELHVYGTVSDPNGCQDLKRVNIKVYRADLGAACPLDGRNCYATSTQAFTGCSGGSDLAASYDAVVPVAFYADPTDVGCPSQAAYWIARTTILDQADLSASASSSGFEVNSLAALGVTPSLDFGILHLGEISAPKVVYLTNYGNRSVVPYFVSQGDMACEAGEAASISTSLLHMHTADQVAACDPTQGEGPTSANYGCTPEQRLAIWNQGLGMDSSQTRTYDTDIPQGSGSILPVSFTLKIPESGVEGDCTTILRVTAVAH